MFCYITADGLFSFSSVRHRYTKADPIGQTFFPDPLPLTCTEEYAREEQKKADNKNAELEERSHQLDDREYSLKRKEDEVREKYNEQWELNERYERLRFKSDAQQREINQRTRDNRKMDEMLLDREQELEKVRDEMKQAQKKSDDTHNDDQLRIRTLERETGIKDSKIADLEQTIVLKDKKIEEKDKKISFWRRLYEKAIEVGQYICDRFRICFNFEKCVDKRDEGYRLNYIFGDDERCR